MLNNKIVENLDEYFKNFLPVYPQNMCFYKDPVVGGRQTKLIFMLGVNIYYVIVLFYSVQQIRKKIAAIV